MQSPVLFKIAFFKEEKSGGWGWSEDFPRLLSVCVFASGERRLLYIVTFLLSFLTLYAHFARLNDNELSHDVRTQVNNPLSQKLPTAAETDGIR